MGPHGLAGAVEAVFQGGAGLDRLGRQIVSTHRGGISFGATHRARARARKCPKIHVAAAMRKAACRGGLGDRTRTREARFRSIQLSRAIATSSSRRTVERHLAAHNLMERFHAIVGHGDYERGKPAPDPFLKAAERLGVEPHLCLALEDSHNGVRSASSAGMMTIVVPDLLEPTEEIRGLCTFVVRDLREVVALFLAT
jgi:beta-phosphoglucomutase-like phosphatase (HAD superfamily)